MVLVVTISNVQYVEIDNTLIGNLQQTKLYYVIRGDILQNNYVEELKNGKQIRIKYNKFIHDYVEDDSGWKEELWCYDNKLDLFKCYYPMSTYEKDFYTTHTEDETRNFMDEAVRDFDNEYDDADVLDIIIENSTIPVSTLAIREAAIEKLKTMTDEEIKRRILL